MRRSVLSSSCAAMAALGMITYLIATPRPALAQGCPVQMMIHSTLVPAETPASGLIRTTDGTVFVRVKPAGRAYSGWRVQSSLDKYDARSVVGRRTVPAFSSRHGFIGNLHELDEERIDVSGGPVAAHVVLTGGTPCSVPVHFVRVPLTAGKCDAIAVLVENTSWQPQGLPDVQLRGGNLLTNAFAAYDGRVLRLLGRLKLNAQFVSRNVVALSTDRDGAFDIASGEGATFTIPSRKGSGWLEPDLVVEGIPYQDEQLRGGQCKGHAALALPSNVYINSPDRNRLEPLTASKCSGGVVTAFEWTEASNQGPTIVGWTSHDRGGDNSGDKFGVCPHITKVDVTVGQPANASNSVLVGDGALDVLTAAERRDSHGCLEALRARGKLDESAAPKIVEMGLLATAQGSVVPTAHVVDPTGQKFFQHSASGFSVCSMDAQFDSDGMVMTFAGVVRAQLVNVPTSLASPSPQKRTAPAALPLNACAPAIGPRPTVPADGTNARTMTINVANVTARVDTNDIPNVQQAKYWKNFSFQNATVDAGKTNSLFGHAIVQCTDAQHTSDKTKISLAANTLCLGVHLSPHETADDAPDVAFGILRLCAQTGPANSVTATRTVLLSSASNGSFACPAWVPAPSDAMAVVGFTAQLPTKEPARVRLGVGSLLISGVSIDVLNDSTAFEKAIGLERLQFLGCDNLSMAGTAAVAALNTGNAPAGPAATLTGATAAADASIASDSSLGSFTAVPTFAMGGGCSIFSLQGFLPIHPTPQSLVVITSLVIAASKDRDGSDLFFLNAAGTVTNANVTGVFQAIGFRTLAKRTIGKPAMSDGCARRDSNPVAARNSKQHHETQYGNLCVVSDINWPLTAGITAAQNANQIGQAIAAAGGALLGIAVKH